MRSHVRMPYVWVTSQLTISAIQYPKSKQFIQRQKLTQVHGQIQSLINLLYL